MHFVWSEQHVDGGGLAVSGHTLLRIVIVLIYVAVCAFSYWRLIPRLSVSAKRLATFMLAAQALVTVLAVEFRSVSNWEGWLWDLDREQNIASALASTLFATVGGVALLTGWLASARPRLQRLYFIGFAFIFFFFAVEEYYSFRGRLDTWLQPYLVLGAVMFVSILIVVARAPLHERKWHICLGVGLAIAAAGATVFEELRFYKTCQALNLFFLGKCRIYAIEETLEFLGIWLALIAMLGLLSNLAPRPQVRVRRALYALPVLWILICPQWLIFLHLEGLLTAQPASVMFQSDENRDGVHLYGYRIEGTADSVAFTLYATAKRSAYPSMGISVHLVDQATGKSYANIDQFWGRYIGYFVGPADRRLYRKSAAVEVPPAIPTNRALWVVLTIWHRVDGRHEFDSVVSSDHPLLGESQVILHELTLPDAPLAFTAQPLAEFGNGFALAPVQLPERAEPGATLDIDFAWHSESNDHPDYIQFLHFVHKENGDQWGFDQQPLGARLPTRLWYSGLSDSETWNVLLPADLAPGRYQIYTGLYRLSDLQRLPATDADSAPFIDARVPLGEIVVPA